MSVSISNKALLPIVNAAWAWAQHLAAMGAKGEEYPQHAETCRRFTEQSDELILQLTILTDALKMGLPKLDDPMDFGGGE